MADITEVPLRRGNKMPITVVVLGQSGRLEETGSTAVMAPSDAKRIVRAAARVGSIEVKAETHGN
ncbi:hypothetical protein GCM10007298_40850 [Williamsia phyllosphaerae]|uniref:Uncharacterized protein n=1 Tax=Williamsia phyllosphaerae TaxID=885042 RepID=A0ABQ1V688_9NOCA|nr:hypothetical protein GCM10007298_40850 [Williamsia phyllosphaerae]